MKLKNWLITLVLPLIVIAEDCASHKDVLNYINGLTTHEKEEITIKANYKIRNWLYLLKFNKLETDGILELSWTNKTLAFSHLNPCHKSVKIKHDLEHWWKPKVFFTDSAEIQDHHKEYKLVVHQDGNVTISKRIMQVLPCHVDSDRHPFSNTTCVLSWKYGTAGYSNVISESSDVVDSVHPKTMESLIFDEASYSLSIDEESQIVYKFFQNPQDLLINFMLPSILFLLPPWLTLLLGPMAITRCCILMTSLILLSIHFNSNLPSVLGHGGVNAISVWKLFSYFFIIAIVIELIMITLLASVGRSKTCCFSKRRSGKYEMEPLYEEMNDLRQRKTRKTRNCCRKTALFVDTASFIFFGILLVAFCYGYYVKRNSVVKMITEFEMESLYLL